MWDLDVYRHDMRYITLFMLILLAGCDDPEPANPQTESTDQLVSKSVEPVLSRVKREQLLLTMAQDVVSRIGGQITHAWFEDQSIALDQPLPDGTSLRCMVGFRPQDAEPAQPGEMNTSHMAEVTLTKTQGKWSPTSVGIQGEVLEGDELWHILRGDGG